LRMATCQIATGPYGKRALMRSPEIGEMMVVAPAPPIPK
jgi:hypothetical protein